MIEIHFGLALSGVVCADAAETQGCINIDKFTFSFKISEHDTIQTSWVYTLINGHDVHIQLQQQGSHLFQLQIILLKMLWYGFICLNFCIELCFPPIPCVSGSADFGHVKY